MSGADDSDGGKDDGRFYCPFPDCKRSFAELWRLKVSPLILGIADLYLVTGFDDTVWSLA